MNRRQFLILPLGLLSGCASRAWSESLPEANGPNSERPPACRPLALENPRYPAHVTFEILSPGYYCLDRDWTQRKLSGAGHVGPGGGALVTIFCGSVTFDLHGFELKSSFGTSGIDLAAWRNRDFFKNYPKRYSSASLDSRFVTIRNGAVDLARGTQTGPGIVLSDEWGWLLTKTPRSYPVRYERNEYLLENLKIYANHVAVLLEGTHNTLRHCVIESSGQAAVFIAGPHVTIEHCEIRLRVAKADYIKAGEPRAAIVLRDGTGAIIRHNTIRVDSAGDEYAKTESHGVYIRDGAQDVLIEGNTFINAPRDPVTLLEGAGAIRRDNKQVKRAWPL